MARPLSSCIQQRSLLTQIIQSNLAKILFGATLIAISTQVSVHLEPVSVTLQTLSVFLIGLTYNPTRASQTVLTYLALGAFGVPVFSDFRSGFMTLLGPTGGYLFGFLIAAWAMATLKVRFGIKQNLMQTYACCLVGYAIIFSIGILRLSQLIGLEKALEGGLYPFVLPELLKITLLTSTLKIVGILNTKTNNSC
ncbi:MAG: biotin transporter BioY [Gammaproteobacteria bacterium]